MRPVTLNCAEPGCRERAFYEVRTMKEDRELRSKPWRCMRHTRPEEVLSPENATRTQTLEVYERPYGKFWRRVGDKHGGTGFTHGPGFKAFAADLPVGAKLIVEAHLAVESEETT